MNIEELRTHCLSIKGSSESCPFLDNTILVFKVMDKMFAYTPMAPKNGIFKVYLKCHPERSIQLREKYRGVEDSEHKTLLWNIVYLESDVPDKIIRELIDHSVEEVIKKLPKIKQEAYKNMP